MRQIDPFDPPKAYLLGVLLSFTALALGAIGQYLPDSVFIVVAAWIIASRKHAQPTQVFAVKGVAPGILGFPIALAFVLKSAEILALTGIDFATGGALGRWSELFPAPLVGESWIADFTIACLLVPVAEELFFRGFFQGALKQIGYGWSIFVPSVFFAVLHHPIAVPGAFVVGVAGGIFTAQYGSVLPAVVFHSSVNFGVLMVGYVEKRYDSPAGFAAYWLICVAGLLLALTIRPEISRIWSESKQAWRDFRASPAFRTNLKFLFRHWSYILLVIEALLAGLLVVWKTFSHS